MSVLTGLALPLACAQAGSLYSGPAPRPGPDLLYADAAIAPQLTNSGIWSAAPILISGASAYRKGEFLYQDWLYDDHGADSGEPDPGDPRLNDGASPPVGLYTYPTQKSYANNAADLVEFRVKPLADATAFRITLNTMLDAEAVAFTLAIGDRSSPLAAMPFGANTRAPATWFVTVHGNQAQLTKAGSDAPASAAASVTVDTSRRQFEVRVPHSVWNPDRNLASFALGVGLWDRRQARYLIPGKRASRTQPGGGGQRPAQPPSAFFNAAFRSAEPAPSLLNVLGSTSRAGWWRDQLQASVLANADLTPLQAEVDFAKLLAGIDDDLPGQPGGVPQSGPMNRILASHYETEQGAVYERSDCGNARRCIGRLRGQLQPYTVYIPKAAAPADGYGLTLLLHSLEANYNQYFGNRNQSQLGDRISRPNIVITPEGRGPDGWYVEYAGADTFEVWADIARHYPLAPERSSVTGYSMGGYGTFRLATLYPDLFARAQTTVGPPAVGTWRPPLAPTGGSNSNTYDQLASLRNLPIMMWVMQNDSLVPFDGTAKQANGIDSLGYRYIFRNYTMGDHLRLAVDDSYADVADFLGDATVERDPAHVSYVVNTDMDFSNVSLIADHAYWLADLRLRHDGPLVAHGSVEAFSHGFGLGDAPASGTHTGPGVLLGGLFPAIPYDRQSQTWSEAPVIPSENRLTLTLRNIASLSVHPGRAKLDCAAVLEVDTNGPATITLDGCNRSETFRR